MHSDPIVLVGSYSPRLVALSVVIAIFASYAGLDLAGRVTAARGLARPFWLMGGASAMGLGIWSMHYIGMLAFSLPIPVLYNWPTVVLSLLAAILASAVAFYVVSRELMSAWRAVVGSILMGVGIAAMHYIGMDAMRLAAMCYFENSLVALSVVLAIGNSFVVLRLAFLARVEKRGGGWRKIASSFVMGVAISVMHYTGMAAASFVPSGKVPNLSHAVNVSMLGMTGIVMVTLLVLGLAVLASLFDRRYSTQKDFWQSIVESLPGIFYLINDLGQLVRWNQTFRDLSGYSAEELSQMSVLDLFKEPDKTLVAERMQQVFSTGEAVAEASFVAKDKTETPYLFSGKRLVFEGKPCLVGLGIDVTERKKAEERFYKAFNANPEPMTIATLSEGRFIDVNESFLRVTGHQREGVIGRTSLEVKFWKSLEDRTRYAEVLEKQGATRDREIAFLTKSGEERTALDSADIVEFDGKKCVIAIFKDITDQKALEKQLRQAQKMEAIGQLSGGIAHDFNNLLGVIIGYSEILEEGLAAGDSLHKSVREIKKAGTRAASLTRQLLAFSRQQVLEPKILALNAVVGNVEKMLGRLIGENIDLESALEPNLGNIKADQGQIEQVIMNLAVNARDAMPHGGRLTILTANIDLDEDYARSHPPQPQGRYVLLSVSDTGIGMDSATQAHIFDPFFTTKELGKGTGLGLSTVYGVIRQSGGHIWVYSELGLGTTFKIYLPRTDEAVHGEKPAIGLDTPLRGTETILLVEDEDPLRELTRGLLANSGYTVLSAAQPADAIEIARQHQGPIHLLLSDVVMPGMSGLALAGKLAPSRPEMKVVYMSGYTGFTHPALFDSDAPVLFKPVARDTLLRKVYEVLAVEVISPSI